MEKHVIILVKSAYEKTPYDKWLMGTGMKSILLVASEFAAGYAHMENVHIFENYPKNDLVVVKAIEFGRDYNVVGLFTRAESDIIRAAKIREELNILGQNVESAMAFRDKVIMKDWLKGSSVKIPNYRSVESSSSVIEFANEFGFPIVVKPVSESGSTGVCIVHDKTSLDNLLVKKPWEETKMEVETFVDGEMYHIDGLVMDGKVVFIQPYKYINDCLEYRKNNFLGGRTVSPSDRVYQGLVDNVETVIRTLPSPKVMAFHAEIWEKENGELIFCEIASRSGGATVGLSVEYGFKFNVDRLWFLAECGLYTSFTEEAVYQPTGWVVIPPLNGRLKDMPQDAGSNDFIVKYQYSGAVGERYYGGVKSGLFLAGYAVKGADEREVEENILQTANWFAENTEWELASEVE